MVVYSFLLPVAVVGLRDMKDTMVAVLMDGEKEVGPVGYVPMEMKEEWHLYRCVCLVKSHAGHGHCLGVSFCAFRLLLSLSTVPYTEQSSNNKSMATEAQLSTEQSLGLSFAQSTAGIASILGSSSVIFISFRRRRTTRVKERLLVALGALDIVSSSGGILNPFLYPSDDNGILHAGNIHTCTVVGILHVFGGLGVALCNACLVLYFYFTVIRRCRQSDLRVAERCWFSIIVLLPMAFCVAGAATRSFGPKPKFDVCYMNREYPLTGCREQNDCDYGGSLLSLILARTVMGCVIIASVVGFVATYKVWAEYRRRVRASSRYLITSQQQQSYANFEEVSRQAIRYSAAYFNMFFWMVLATFVEYIHGVNRTFLFCLTLFGTHMYLLQGVFNAVIYIRPLFVQWRQAMPEASFSSVLLKCYSADVSNRRSQSKGKLTTRSSSRSVLVGPKRVVVADAAAAPMSLPESIGALPSPAQDAELPSPGGGA